MAYDVTSQWDDIHRRLGNYEPLPVVKKQSEYYGEAQDKMDDYDPFQNKDDKDLDELEDDLDDDFLRAYKEQRMAELNANADPNAKKRFAGVREISKDIYVAEVNKAPKGVWVV